MNRREFLVKSATAGTLAWTVPTVVSVARADASDLGSRPPKPFAPPPEYPTATGPELPKGLPSQLPFTGDDEHKHINAGTAAVVSGAALWALAKEERRYE